MTCAVQNCGKKVFARGICASHYARAKRAGALPAIVIRHIPRGGVCVVDGCEKIGDRRGMCSMHYERLRKTGSVGPAGRIQRERGAGTPNEHGYFRVFKNGKRKMLHREVMEKVLGRALLPTEDVHHRDGDRSNNAPENLELWTRSHPHGQRVADKVAWAATLLKQYPEFLTGYRLVPLESAEATAIRGTPSFADFDPSEVIRRYKSPTG